MIEVKVELGAPLEDIISLLADYSLSGVEAYCDFGIVKFYNDSESLAKYVEDIERLYLRVYGKRRVLFFQEKERIDLVNKGYKYIYPEKGQDWEDLVKKYESYGVDIHSLIKLLEILDNGDYKQALMFCDSLEDPTALVKYALKYSKNGPEFYRKVFEHQGNEMSRKQEKILAKITEENMKFAVSGMTRQPVEFVCNKKMNLERAVETLRQAYNRGECYYINFEGHKLVSDRITYDKAYRKIYGLTKEETEFKRKREAFLFNVDYYIDEGKKFIAEDKHIDWEVYMRNYATVPTNLGVEIEAALNVIKRIDADISYDTIERTFGYLYNNYITKKSKDVCDVVMEIVSKFSPYGSQFVGEANRLLEQKMVAKKEKKIA